MSSVASPSLPPKPAPPAPAETKEAKMRRLLAKARMFRESAISKRGSVEGDPAKIYCWVNIREERQLHFQGMGWELVVDKDHRVKTQHWQEDTGHHKRADLILYAIDRDLFDAMEADQQLRALEQMEGASASFEASAERLGAPVYKPR